MRPNNLPQQLILIVFGFAVLAFVLSAGAKGTFAQEGDPAGEAIALFNRGQDAHEKGELKEALELYDQALKIIPEFPEAELQRANALHSLGRTADSEAAFRRAVEIRPDWTMALAGLGAVLVEQGKYKEAEPVLSKAISLDSQNFPAFAALVDLRLKTDAGPDALGSLLTQISALTDKARPPASIWAARAALERALGNVAAARGSISNALRLDPRSRSALFEGAAIALAANDPAAAENYARQLGPLGTNDQQLMVLRARILVARGRSGEALQLLEAIQSPDINAVKLKAALNVNSSVDVAGLEARLKADPKNLAILGRLCTLYRAKEPEKALDLCRRALEADPADVGYAIGYGAALVQAKRFSDAAALLKKLIEVEPNNATAHANLATALFQLKDYSAAKAEYLWLIERQPDLAAAYFFLAVAHDQLGEYLDAMANYQQFLRLADPSASKLEIEKVNLRLPGLQKLINERKGKKNG